jgi:hypothetical protein
MSPGCEPPRPRQGYPLPARVDLPGLVLDLDATLVTSHSEKEQAAATYKRGFGYHPLLCSLDNTGEALAGVLTDRCKVRSRCRLVICGDPRGRADSRECSVRVRPGSLNLRKRWAVLPDAEIGTTVLPMCGRDGESEHPDDLD